MLRGLSQDFLFVIGAAPSSFYLYQRTLFLGLEIFYFIGYKVST